EGLRPRLGEVPRGDGARGTGPELPELVRLDDREHLRAVAREEDDDEPGAALEDAVSLQAGHTEVEVGRGHDVQDTWVEPEPEPRPELDAACSHPAEATLDRLDRLLGREQLSNLGFTEIEGHRGAVV